MNMVEFVYSADWEAAWDLVKNVNHMRKIAGEPQLVIDSIDDYFEDDKNYENMLADEQRLIRIMNATRNTRHSQEKKLKREWILAGKKCEGDDYVAALNDLRKRIYNQYVMNVQKNRDAQKGINH